MRENNRGIIEDIEVLILLFAIFISFGLLGMVISEIVFPATDKPEIVKVYFNSNHSK